MSDVLVVGAGVIGALTVAELKRRRPDLDVELLEMSPIATAGASARAGAIDGPYSWSQLHHRLRLESWRWHDLGPLSAGSRTYRRAIKLHWLGRERDREQIADVVRAERESACVPSGYDASLCAVTDAYVIDPLALIDAAIEYALDRGVRLARGVRLLALHKGRTVVRAICGDGSERVCRHAILAVGPWVADIADSEFQVDPAHGLRVKRVHGLRILAKQAVGRTAGWADPERGLFLFPRNDSLEWAMSIKHAVWDVDPDAVQMPDTGLLERAQPLLDCVFGQSAWSVCAWPTFADSYTTSWTPVVEWVAGGAATVVSGTHGSGVRLAPALARRAAALALRSLSSQVTPKPGRALVRQA